MDDKKFQKLLDKAVDSAIKHRELMKLVGDECIERFGYHYSDLDIDNLIDAVDHGHGYISVNQIIQDYKWVMQNRGLKHKDLND
jgi:hypothetical protein